MNDTFSWFGPTRSSLKGSGRRSTVSRNHPFIFGPIDLAWVAEARKLGVSPLHLGLGLWYLRGIKKSDVFLVSNILVEQLGLKPDAKSRALRKLEAAGLVYVERRGKRSPRVTLVAPQRALDNDHLAGGSARRSR